MLKKKNRRFQLPTFVLCFCNLCKMRWLSNSKNSSGLCGDCFRSVNEVAKASIPRRLIFKQEGRQS